MIAMFRRFIRPAAREGDRAACAHTTRAPIIIGALVYYYYIIIIIDVLFAQPPARATELLEPTPQLIMDASPAQPSGASPNC